MSYTDFATTIEDSLQCEWVNGEATIFVPHTTRHQLVAGFLSFLLNGFVRIYDLGWVFPARTEMHLPIGRTFRQPDILFLAKANSYRMTEVRIEGPADLVIELVSDDSVARDRGDKFYEYQANGIREYWIIDPRHGFERADFWVFDETNRFRPVPINANGIYHSTVLPNFWLDANDLLAKELPNPLPIFAKLVGIDRIKRAFGLDQ